MKEEHLKVLEELSNGVPYKEVGAKFGYSHASIARIRGRAIEKILELAGRGMDSPSISRILNFPPRFVDRALTRYHPHSPVETRDETGGETRGKTRGETGGETGGGTGAEREKIRESETSRLPCVEKNPDEGIGEGGGGWKSGETGLRSEKVENETEKVEKKRDESRKNETKKVGNETENVGKKGVEGRKMEEELASSARLLRGILQRARGVGADSVGGIIDFYNDEPEAYENNPYNLLGLLQAYGVKAVKANFIVNQFMTALHGAPSLGYPIPQPGEQRVQQPWYQWSQPYLSKERGTERGEDRRRAEEMDRYFKYFLQASTVQMLRGGNQPAMPWANVTQEPILDGAGKPVKDETGNPIMRTIINPMQLPRAREGGKREGENRFVEDMAKIERTRADDMEKRMLEVIKTNSDKTIADLQARVDYLGARNPLDLATDTMKKMREMGVVYAF